jgi:hypothetical protein
MKEPDADWDGTLLSFLPSAAVVKLSTAIAYAALV